MATFSTDSVIYDIDIITGHVLLAYMEDHLLHEGRLSREWQSLCNYKPDECNTNVGSDLKNTSKNRDEDILPFDHNRLKLNSAINECGCDYINASVITDTDPRRPSYIATQGPLENTVADFWQMVWEQGIVVIVNLTQISEKLCHRYWPLDGKEVYHNYEVHLISEHIWCDNYLVRSFYLKDLLTGHTRSITQFHYQTWPEFGIPPSPFPLLEFRRKVNKCYRGHACPIIVHCNNGIGRTGTYILLDMVLNKMRKGAKEMDISATLEHLRDQRQGLVRNSTQFEFSLIAVAQEISMILDAVGK